MRKSFVNQNIRRGETDEYYRADALFICYQIDRELGGQHSEEAKGAFLGEQPRGSSAV